MESNLNKILNFIMFLVLIFLIIYTGFFTYRSITSIIYPYQLDYGEGAILNQVNELIQGNSIYVSIDDYPFIQGNYPPVFHLFTIPGILLFGPNFFWPRFISVLSTFLIALFSGLIVKEISQNNLLSVITGFLYLSIKYVFVWAPLARIDMMGVMFAVVGIYWVLKYHNSKKLFWANIFFLLAVYTRQSLFAAPISAYIWLIIQNREKGIIHLKKFFISGFSLFIFLTVITRGQFFLHLVLYNMDETSWQTVQHYLSEQLSIYLLLLLFGIMGIILLIKDKKILIPLYFLISFMFSLTIAKVGSNVNYLVEFYAALCISAVLFLHYLFIYVKQQKKLSVKILAVFGIVLFFFHIVTWYHIPYGQEWIETYGVKRNQGKEKEVLTLIKNTEGPVISEDMGLLALSGKKVQFEPFEFTQLFNQGYWDQDLLLDDIEKGKFEQIIIKFNPDNPDWRITRFNYDFLRKLKFNYVLRDKKGEYRIYEPRPSDLDIDL
ncbi:MAG: ArnT family glycosyltransferase [Halanaerobiaceae bacterium]